MGLYPPELETPDTGEGIAAPHTLLWATNLGNTPDTVPGSLKIYYSCNQYPTYCIDCWCKRWDESNYDITIETYLTSSARDTLFRYIMPGSILEYNNSLGWIINLDATYSRSGNTLILEPQSGYGLSGIRSKKVTVVKNASDTFINSEYFNVKLELKEKKKWSDYL